MDQQKLKKIIENLDPESYRMKLIETARQFKSNWVELGKHLTAVASEKNYETWGYKSFEEYCRQEIKIKKGTAIKLTSAYFFMTQEDPEIFKSFRPEDLPDFEAVSVLQKAKNDSTCSPENYQMLREAALDKGQTGTTLARKYKKLSIEPEKVETKSNEREDIVLIANLKKRLVQLPDVPEKFKVYLDEIEEFLNS